MTDLFCDSVISLVKSALFGTKEEISAELDWNEIVKLTKDHQIHALIYYGILACDARPPEQIRAALENNAFMSIMVDRNQTFAVGELLKAFSENGIEHMPLKGTLLKSLYPKSELRAMSDADILIKPEQYDRIRPIMQSLGYTEGIESDHEYVWIKANVLTVELHKRLIPSYNRDYYAYYGDGWQLAKKADGSCFYMSDEDQFIYLFTHFSKHYRDGGIGIRHFADLQIYLTAKPDLDMAYIENELKKLQLDTFYKNVRQTLKVWFEGNEKGEVTDFVTARIFGSGSYGTYDGRLLSSALKEARAFSTGKKARTKRIWRLIFPAYHQMITTFPFLEKCPVLLPFLWIYRWLRALLFRRGTIAKKRGEIKITTVDRVENYQQELHFVGLDFNFKE